MSGLAALLKAEDNSEKIDLNIFYDEAGVFIKRMSQRYPGFHKSENYATGHLKFHTHHPNENDKPINVGSKEEMYEEMRKAVRTMHGINFVLGMQRDDGQLQVWRRPDQPCQGGETRKYGCTHDDCTRPDDPRPGDLRYEFPDGKPLAVGVGHYEGIKPTNFELITHPLSPYRRGFGHTSNVERVLPANGFSNQGGFILLSLDNVEPTMFVTLAKATKEIVLNNVDLLKHVTIPEYFWLNKICNLRSEGTIYIPNFSLDASRYGDNYIFNKDYLKGGVEASADLSGGFYGNRVDYNRPELTEVWKKKGKNVFYGKAFRDTFGNSSYGELRLNISEFIPRIPELRERTEFLIKVV